MFAPILIVLILGVSYSRTIAPDLTWAHFSADGGDLIAAAATAGVPHPGGYPLYLILARGFQFIPIGTLAFRTNLFSSVCTILASLVLYAFLAHQFRGRPMANFTSLFAVLTFGLAPLVWGQALVTEVYALHGLLMIACLYVSVVKKPHASEWTRGLIFGIAAANHLASIMIFPLLFFRFDERSFVSPQVFFRRSFGLLSGLSLYLMLPLRAYLDPPVNWGDASTIQGFVWLISGKLYYNYPFSLTFAGVIQRIRAFAGLLLGQYTWAGILLSILGLLSLSSRRVLVPTLWIGMAFFLFALFYGSYDSQVNLLPVWLCIAIWLAYGLQELFAWIQDRSIISASFSGLLFIAFMIRIPSLLSEVDVSGDFQARDFMNHALIEIPHNSLVFVESDERIFSLWYAQFALGQRPDMIVVANGLISFDWYVENLRNTYPQMNIPERVCLRPFDLIAANPDRTVCFISADFEIKCN